MSSRNLRAAAAGSEALEIPRETLIRSPEQSARTPASNVKPNCDGSDNRRGGVLTANSDGRGKANNDGRRRANNDGRGRANNDGRGKASSDGRGKQTVMAGGKQTVMAGGEQTVMAGGERTVMAGGERTSMDGFLEVSSLRANPRCEDPHVWN